MVFVFMSAVVLQTLQQSFICSVLTKFAVMCYTVNPGCYNSDNRQMLMVCLQSSTISFTKSFAGVMPASEWSSWTFIINRCSAIFKMFKNHSYVYVWHKASLPNDYSNILCVSAVVPPRVNTGMLFSDQSLHKIIITNILAI